MRAFRGLTVALMLVNAGVADAQASRGFKDSWFWGAKGGLLNYQVMEATGPNTSSPTNTLGIMAGGDWMITRTSGGLYVGVDYTLMSHSVLVNDSISPLDINPRTVALSGLRRFTFAGLFFPLQTYRLHPYFGMGFTLQHVSKATPQGTFRTKPQEELALGTIASHRSTMSPVLMVGAQLRIPLAQLFGQVITTPAHDGFFLFTGGNWRTSLEAGLRWNLGSSIDRLR
jgi:hypothetical protein